VKSGTPTVTTIPLGRGNTYKGGPRFDWTLEIKETPSVSVSPHQTIDHMPVTDYLEITYSVIGQGRYESQFCWTRGESAIADLRAAGLATKRIRSLIRLLDGWHLNGMQARCAHQQGWNLDAMLSMPGDCGYLCGHAWLVRVIPPDTLADIRTRVAALEAVS
jgi:hypothetical protein